MGPVVGFSRHVGGAAVFAEVYQSFKETVLTWGDFGKITLPQALEVNRWIIIGSFVIGGLGLFRWFEKRGF